MQKDFHYAAIYVLSRLAGMKSEYAEKVAYSSQQVDDAVYDHALKFEDGDIFHQTQTAHKKLGFIKSSDVNESFNVWIPFHFLPAAESDDVRLMTKPESTTVNFLKEDIMKSGNQNNILYRLGIFLHLYADTYSHQDFKGFYDRYNLVELLDGVEDLSIKDKLKKLATEIIPGVLPIGHALSIKNPDIPYASWKYSRNSQMLEVNNLEERFLPAAKNIFIFLRKFLLENNEFGSVVEDENLEFRLSELKETLKFRGTLEERYKNWLSKIHNNYFKFEDFDSIDENLNYNDRKWFKEAVEVKKCSKLSIEGLKQRAYNYNKFYKKDNFDNADWTLYMKAAAEHKYKVIHKILPQAGLNVG
ncbi:DUF6765 family protein [Halanaerobium congolense]|uniref:DUF6765 family protein n=1 Tax=Halanaerobium congolense TaxID=54121 RepID=UPI00088D9C33|nr:DUF6765 family protein [Halanaerobium congolense]SDK65966.1 hypothetical protein SAMN04515655_11033 [Halanaerobium congolense]SDM32486.1 hypothetical protein SAMN04488599_10933 [Halanaerobium congolense]